MIVTDTIIPGVFIIEPRVFEDARGYFFESFSQRDFDDNISKKVFSACADGHSNPQYPDNNGSIVFV